MKETGRDSDLRVVNDFMRTVLEEHGVQFTPSFEQCVQIVRRDQAREGRFMSFEETAFHIMSGGIEELGLTHKMPPSYSENS